MAAAKLLPLANRSFLAFPPFFPCVLYAGGWVYRIYPLLATRYETKGKNPPLENSMIHLSINFKDNALLQPWCDPPINLR